MANNKAPLTSSQRASVNRLAEWLHRNSSDYKAQQREQQHTLTNGGDPSSSAVSPEHKDGVNANGTASQQIAPLPKLPPRINCKPCYHAARCRRSPRISSDFPRVVYSAFGFGHLFHPNLTSSSLEAYLGHNLNRRHPLSPARSMPSQRLRTPSWYCFCARLFPRHPRTGSGFARFANTSRHFGRGRVI